MKEFMNIIIRTVKKFFIISLMLLAGSNITAGQASPDLMQMPGDVPTLPNGNVYVPFVGEMKPEELDNMMNKVNTFLEQMSPEELNNFMNLAEDLAVDMINENPEALVPPGGYAAPKKPAEKEVAKPAQPEKPKVEEKKEEKPKEEPKKDTAELKKILKGIREKTIELRIKVSTGITIKEFDEIEEELDDFVSFLYIIKKDKHIHRLYNDEFKELLEKLHYLYEILEEYEPKVIIPDAIDEKDKADSITKMKSKEALKIIAEVYKEILVKNKMLKKVEEFIEKYEPEAAKMRKQAEEEEAKAMVRKEPVVKSNLSRQRSSIPPRPPAPYHGASPYGQYGHQPSPYYDPYYSSQQAPQNRPRTAQRNASDMSGKAGEKSKEQQQAEGSRAAEEQKKLVKLDKKMKGLSKEIEAAFEDIGDTEQQHNALFQGFPAYMGQPVTAANPANTQYDTLFGIELRTKARTIRNRIESYIDSLEDKAPDVQRRYIDLFKEKHDKAFQETLEKMHLHASFAANVDATKRTAHQGSIARFETEYKNANDARKRLDELKSTAPSSSGNKNQDAGRRLI